MDYFNFKVILISLFLYYLCQTACAKSLPALPDDCLDKVLADVPSNEETDFNLRIGVDPVTICWNVKTTLHFYQNGTKSGYVEYSISLDFNPSENKNPKELPTEQYEIFYKNSSIPRVLDFVTISASDLKTVKENRSLICKSEKGYTSIVTNLEGRKKVEVKMRPVIDEIDMSSVRPLNPDVNVALRVLPEEADEPVTNTDATIEEFIDLEQAGAAFGQKSTDSGAANRQLHPNITPSSHVSLEDDLEPATTPPSSDSTPTPESSEPTTTPSSSESATTPSSLEPASTPSSTDQSLNDSEKLPSSEAPKIEDSTSGCNRRRFLKVRLGVEDDSGQLGKVEKDLEIDADQLFESGPGSNFERQLALLIRKQFSDVLGKNKECQISSESDKSTMINKDSDESQTDSLEATEAEETSNASDHSSQEVMRPSLSVERIQNDDLVPLFPTVKALNPAQNSSKAQYPNNRDSNMFQPVLAHNQNWFYPHQVSDEETSSTENRSTSEKNANFRALKYDASDHSSQEIMRPPLSAERIPLFHIVKALNPAQSSSKAQYPNNRGLNMFQPVLAHNQNWFYPHQISDEVLHFYDTANTRTRNVGQNYNLFQNPNEYYNSYSSSQMNPNQIKQKNFFRVPVRPENKPENDWLESLTVKILEGLNSLKNMSQK